MKYDYLIVGAGLYGAMFAHLAREAGKRVVIIERRRHIGGNLHCQTIEGIAVHMYGPHIFHTSNQKVWEFVNSMTPFVPYVYSPIADYHGKRYNLPFNMNTFQQLWGVKSPEEAQMIIVQQVKEANIECPKNLEEQAICMVGRDLYEYLIKGYTEKQWGRPAKELPSSIIKRIPVRFTYDNNYFNDTYQGIPKEGYNALICKLLEGIEVRLNTDYLQNKELFQSISNKTIYTGCIDEFFGNYYGKLEYRSLRFEHEQLDVDNFQGTAAVNYTDSTTPYTRIIEHKHFLKTITKKTVITREYPQTPTGYNEAYYPINDERNNSLYNTYVEMASRTPKVSFGGRLGEYTYYNMDQVIEKVLGIDFS
jgi:UDP-galactopyranose mutase